MKKLKIASLFSGCGGMDLGFEGGFDAHKSSLTHNELLTYDKFNSQGFIKLGELPFETVFACDVNQKAKLAWENYFSKRRNVNDIYQVKSIVDIVKEMRNGSYAELRDINVVTGGFPCNDFSVAGKRLGFNSDKSHQGNKKIIQGDDDPTVENRGMLYYWMREFISETRPKVFYAENVKGLVSLGNAVDIISKRTLSELETFIWKNGKAQAMDGYNDDLIMALGIGLWVRDTALRLRQEGIDLTIKSLGGIQQQIQESGFYGGSSMDDNPWSMKVGNQDEDLTWLIK